MSGPERQAFADRARRLARRLAEYSQENIVASLIDLRGAYESAVKPHQRRRLPTDTQHRVLSVKK